jgi:hypothetical protein
MMFKLAVFGAAILTTLNGCATSLPSRAEAVTIERGGCFGFCPVYSLETRQDGTVIFTGIRHTAYLGVKQHRVSKQAASIILAKLAEFRPTAASSELPCTTAGSDQARYVLTWDASRNAPSTSLEFNSGCRSPEGNRLRLLLESIPGLSGVEADAKQMTRPGVPRG